MPLEPLPQVLVTVRWLATERTGNIFSVLHPNLEFAVVVLNSNWSCNLSTVFGWLNSTDKLTRIEEKDLTLVERDGLKGGGGGSGQCLFLNIYICTS